MEDPAALPGVARSLQLVFSSAEALRLEYARNLVKGGAFVPTKEHFELREVVEVRVHASFSGETLALAAEVVHCAPKQGVAVQFLDPTPELRARFDELLEHAEAKPEPASRPAEGWMLGEDEADGEAGGEVAAPGDDGEAPSGVGGFDEADFTDLSFELDAEEQAPAPPAPRVSRGPQRSEADTIVREKDPNERTHRQRAERAPARVPVRVQGPTGQQLEARTRDLSKSGLLLSVDGEELPIGRDVQLELTHPGTGEALAVSGRVVRHIEGEGVVPAVAVALEPGARAEVVERFVEDVQRADEEQRKGGIRGPLEELGAVSLLQMFAALARRGTLTVTSGVEEGVVAFEDGQLLAARVGSVRGTKALARIFGWRAGFFEFRGHVDSIEQAGTPGPMEGAILEALRLIDEGNRLTGPQLAGGARFAVRRERLGALDRALGKTEEAVLELAAAGFTVRRILDVIPENDVQIKSAIATLLERGLIEPTD